MIRNAVHVFESGSSDSGLWDSQCDRADRAASQPASLPSRAFPARILAGWGSRRPGSPQFLFRRIHFLFQTKASSARIDQDPHSFFIQTKRPDPLVAFSDESLYQVYSPAAGYAKPCKFRAGPIISLRKSLMSGAAGQET